jgi:hypothetical protein
MNNKDDDSIDGEYSFRPITISYVNESFQTDDTLQPDCELDYYNKNVNISEKSSNKDVEFSNRYLYWLVKTYI